MLVVRTAGADTVRDYLSVSMFLCLRVMACIVRMSVLIHTTAPCSISLFGVCLRCLSVPIWLNIRTCGCFMAPQSGITLTNPVFRTPHHTLSSSYNLVRAPHPLCRCWPPHGSQTVQRLQALCPAHRLHTVPSFHSFRRAPPALSQVTLCRPRSLRPLRASPLQNS